jgi:hypothetical protein
MTRLLIFVMTCGCGLAANDALAQLPYLQSRSFSSYGRPGGIGPTSRPTFSPYLNLLRGENSTLLNYYGLVRPEIEFRAANQQFQAGFGRVDAQLRDTRGDGDGSRLSQSGHQVQFMSNLQGPQGSLVSPQRGTTGGYSQLGVTGHSAWFGNTGVWYQPFGQGSGSPSRQTAPQQSPSGFSPTGFSPSAGAGSGRPSVPSPSAGTSGVGR